MKDLRTYFWTFYIIYIYVYLLPHTTNGELYYLPERDDPQQNKTEDLLHEELQPRYMRFPRYRSQEMIPRIPKYVFEPMNNGPCQCGRNGHLHVRILGGIDADLNEFPWQVALFSWTKGIFCGGALLNSRYVLTAAHCLINNTRDIKVVLGEHDVSTNVETKSKSIKAEKIIIHPEYIRNNHNKDIAIIRMAKPVKFDTTVKPACLASPNYDYTNKNKKTIISGWGAIGEGKPSHAVLQKATVRIMNQLECRKLLGAVITDSVVCAGGAKGVDACQGDSGGPLIQDDGLYATLVGIVAWGSGCGSDLPGVYTRTTKFVDWIYSNIKDGEFCR